MLTLILASVLCTALAHYPLPRRSSEFPVTLPSVSIPSLSRGYSGYGGNNYVYVGGNSGFGAAGSRFGGYSSYSGSSVEPSAVAYMPSVSTIPSYPSLGYGYAYNTGSNIGSVSNGYASGYGYASRLGSSSGMRVAISPQLSKYMGSMSSSSLIGQSYGMPGGGSLRIRGMRRGRMANGRGATLMVVQYDRGTGRNTGGTGHNYDLKY